MGRVRPLALLTTVASLAVTEGCHSWLKPYTKDGVPVFSPGHAARATLTDGTVVELANPRVVGDSLLGDVGTPAYHAAIAMSEVKRLEERKVSAAKTGGLALGCGAILLGTLGLVLFAALLGGME